MSELISYDESLPVKDEPDTKECILCLNKSPEYVNISSSLTTSSRTSLISFIERHSDITVNLKLVGYICHLCNTLVNQLDSAEVEFIKAKALFTDIISRNPLFFTLQPLKNDKIVLKEEPVEFDLLQSKDSDTDDEPLAVTQKKRKRKVKNYNVEEKFSPNNRSPEFSKKKFAKSKVNGVKDELENDQGIEQNIENYDLASKTRRRKCSKLKENIETIIENDVKVEVSDNHDSDKDWASSLEDHSVDEQFKVKSDVKSKRGRRKKTSHDKADPEMIKDVPNTEVKTIRRNNQFMDVYSCMECRAYFTVAGHLMRHMEKHNLSKPPYICEICGAKYKHKKACDIHVAMHKGISDWRCDECDKIFPSKNALKRHNAIHTGKAIYQCDLCGKSFIHTSSFKMHKLSHTGLKPHKCDVCGLALMTRSHLKRHARIHSGEKRHECTTCGKRFSERYNLFAHQKSHGETSADQPIEKKPAIRTFRGFRCTLCEQRFERRYMLEKHMELIHQRILEKGPAKPRNTMTKLLKAKAAAAAKLIHSTVSDIPEEKPEIESPNKTAADPVALVRKAKVVQAGGEQNLQFEPQQWGAPFNTIYGS